MKCTIKLLISLILVSCNQFIPTVEHPTPDLWCAQWNVYGEDILVCARTQELLQQKLRSLQAKELTK